MSGISFSFKGKNYMFDDITMEQVECLHELIDYWDKHNVLNIPRRSAVLESPHQNDKVDLEHSEKSLLWWGYMHSNGSIQVKRYFGTQDITEARQSPFVHQIVGPFKAFGRADAETYVNEQLKDIV